MFRLILLFVLGIFSSQILAYVPMTNGQTYDYGAGEYTYIDQNNEYATQKTNYDHRLNLPEQTESTDAKPRLGAFFVLLGDIDVTKSAGRSGKQARLRELANDPKLGKADRGWIKQEKNSIARGNRKTIRCTDSDLI